MTEFSSKEPKLPNELTHLVDDHFLGVHEKWQNADFENVLPHIPSLETIDIGEEQVRIARLRPLGEVEDGRIALAFPYLQPLNRTMLLRSAFLQQAVFPNQEIVLLPQTVSGNQAAYTLSENDALRLSYGRLTPVAEKYAKVFETLGIKDIALTGYSLGGRIAADIAAVGGDYNVTGLNVDEAPSWKKRGPKKLQEDFMHSGGYFDQRRAMADSGLGALTREYAGVRLVADYANFAKKSLKSAAKDIRSGMSGDGLAESVYAARRHNPTMHTKIGTVEGSKLTDPGELRHIAAHFLERIRIVEYTGEAARAHTTGDNYAAHALMVKDGLATK